MVDLMLAVMFGGGFAFLVGLVVWKSVLGTTGLTPSERAKAARQYASWLRDRYPDVPIRKAVEIRMQELYAESPHPHDKHGEEIMYMGLVNKGWDLWKPRRER